MDISQSLHGGASISSGPQHAQTYGYPRRKPSHHGRSASFSASLMSLLSPTAGSTPAVMGERSPSVNGNSPSIPGYTPIDSPGPDGGFVLEEDIDPELPLPTFETQPSMLAVDLLLLPGDSRSCTSNWIINWHLADMYCDLL